MNLELAKQDIIAKLKDIAARDGKAPGRQRFEAVTGIKPHVWRGRLWRQWSDALAEAGLSGNALQGAFEDEDLLRSVFAVAKEVGRFPTTGDIDYMLRREPGAPSPKTIFARWRMEELSARLAEYADQKGEREVANYASAYVPVRRDQEDEGDSAAPVGHVYMQRHGRDYKIGRTSSLNKRGRQIQLELPQEVELVHSILTDDPPGVEAYWHNRFADKRTRGEWFKLTKADIAAFRRWSKIW